MYKYHDFGFLIEPVGPLYYASTHGVKSFTQTNIDPDCTNRKGATWTGETYSIYQMVLACNAKEYHAEVWAPNCEEDFGT